MQITTSLMRETWEIMSKAEQVTALRETGLGDEQKAYAGAGWLSIPSYHRRYLAASKTLRAACIDLAEGL